MLVQPPSVESLVTSLDAALAQVSSRGASEKDKETLLALLARVADPLVDTPSKDSLLRRLDDRSSIVDRPLVASALLRSLGFDGMAFLLEQPWSFRIAGLLESEFESLYRELRIPAQSQTYEKLDRLRPVFDQCERALQTAVSSLTSLGSLHSARTATMKWLNGSLAKALVWPFLPRGAIDLLGDAFRAADDYERGRLEVDATTLYETAETSATRLADLLSKVPTAFSNSIKVEVAERLLSLLESDFAKNPLALRATFAAHSTSKLYSLNIEGADLNLHLVLENKGPGFAQDVQLTIVLDSGVNIGKDAFEIGGIRPGETRRIDIPARVLWAVKEVDCEAELTWTDRKEPRTESFTITFCGHGNVVDWGALEDLQPYSLDAVPDAKNLIGRRDTLQKIVGHLKRSSGCVVRGQKRVGKTSIAKAACDRMSSLGHVVVYIEAGAVANADGKEAVTGLGLAIVKSLRSRIPAAKAISIPEFAGTLSPLVAYLEDLREICPDVSITLVIDEFDEMPFELFDYTEEARAFALTLRSLSSLDWVGLMLVGGEKMFPILDNQGMHLNKFNSVVLDYFLRETDWTDYCDLVQRPTQGILTFSEDAIDRLHRYTSGNPFFTNMICQQIYDRARIDEDPSITEAEVESAVADAVRKADLVKFKHFWGDRILKMGPEAAAQSATRIKILIALADTIKCGEKATIASVKARKILESSTSIESEVQDFIQRGVLDLDYASDTLAFKVPLLYAWLRDRGVTDVLANSPELDHALALRREEEAKRVKPEEIVALVGSWPCYLGQKITEDRVRVWLDQFGESDDQRLGFTILKRTKFISEAYLHQKIEEAHARLRRHWTRRIVTGEKKRRDVLITYLDGPSKSGAHCARIYARVADVLQENVVERAQLAKKLKSDPRLDTLVLVDDFVGTGDSACKGLQLLIEDLKAADLKSAPKIYFFPVIAVDEGLQRLEAFAGSCDPHVVVEAAETLGPEARVFGDRSATFPQAAERRAAEDLVRRHSDRIGEKKAYGYGNYGLSIVFERGCPNNTLPLLWKETNSPRWIPLFPRH